MSTKTIIIIVVVIVLIIGIVVGGCCLGVGGLYFAKKVQQKKIDSVYEGDVFVPKTFRFRKVPTTFLEVVYVEGDSCLVRKYVVDKENNSVTVFPQYRMPILRLLREYKRYYGTAPPIEA